ncbi:MAG: aminoglycoside phosphotransferase family protein [Actinobacteria bacterium]|nr:aminoglycoside phosphotransferase family protein [Actinomycetota bacterium]
MPDKLLVVLAAASSPAVVALAQGGRIGPASIIVLLGDARLGREALRCAKRTAGLDFEQVLDLRAVPTEAGTTFYFPADNRDARKHVWNGLIPPMSFKGRLARTPLGRTGRTLVSRIRETGVTIAGPAGTVVDQAYRTIIASAPWEASKPLVAIEVADAPRDGSHGLRVVKIPRRPSFSSMLVREQTQLRRVQRIMPGAPVRPLGSVSWGPYQGWGQSAVHGVPFDHRPWARRLDELERLAVWLFDLERLTSRRVGMGEMTPPAVGAWVRSIAHSAQANLELRHHEHDYLERLPVRLENMGISLTFAHRDAGPWNVVSSGGRAILIDWESAGWGLPGGDLLFLLAFVLTGRNGAWAFEEKVDVFRSRFVDPSTRPPWLGGILLRLQRHLGVDDEGFRDVLATTMLGHALNLSHLALTPRGKMPKSEPYLEWWRDIVAAKG